MRDDPDQQYSNGLAAILADYLTRTDRGEPISREAFLAEHAEHFEALREYFADVDLIEQLAAVSPGDSSPSLAATPREFGQYDSLSEIGRGGMGIVYRARERSTGRLLALKMLLRGFLSSAEVLRFRNEARTAAALRHPGIVPIYHVGDYRGHLFYTMPLIKGINLAQRISNGPLEPGLAARLVLSVAEAVEFAHSREVVHRDLKPANILLDEHERPYVADFGLARCVGEEPLGVTRTGDLLGTPNYMAPEQVNGHHALVGPAADVYAMGAVLYALLVGQPPFQSDSISDTLQKICSTEPVPPRQIRRIVPRDLETICLKCLEKLPANRYRSAGELAEDLRRFQAGEPLFAQRVSRLERGRRWFVRNPVTGTLTVGIALALIVGTGLSTHYAGQARQRERQALVNLYAADINLAQQHVRSGAVASALRLLERHRPAPGAADSQGWEWRHLWQQCRGELRSFEGPQGAVYTVAFSPDGQTVAAGGADQTVWIWETATGKVKFRLSGHNSVVRDLAYAPEGRRLATVGDDGVGMVWDTTTGKRIATLAVPIRNSPSPVLREGARGGADGSNLENPPVGHERPLTTVAFTADGRFFATGGNDEATVNVWDAATHALRQSLNLGPAGSLAFAPDGGHLAIAGRDGSFRVCHRDEAGSWTLTATIRGHDVVRDLTWSSDGTHFATGGKDALKLWDPKTWRELTTFALLESVYGIRFSPDGRRIAVAARNEPVKVWNLDETQPVSELLGHTGLVTCVDFCPDGWRLVTASEDGTVRLWVAVRATDHDRLDGHLGHVHAVAFSPDGDMLASGGADGAIVLWNPLTCQPLFVLRSAVGYISDLSFSPDGSKLAASSASSHLHIWNVASATETLDLALGPGPLIAVAWAPDGKRVAVQAIGTTRLIDATMGRELASWSSPNGPNGSIAFNNDGQLLLNAGGDESIRIWDTASQSLVRELRGHTAAAVNAVFNPDGSLIASSSNDHTIRLWDAATGRHLHTLTGHSGTPHGLAFTPDGTRLASSSTDQTVKIWDIATGLELQSLVGHTDWVRDIAFNCDGQSLASAGYDGTVRIWHAPNQAADFPVDGVSDRGSDAVSREASGLVKHWAGRTASREQLVMAIESDGTVNNTVRAAAIHQAEESLFYWPVMLAGHRAAERGDWPAAVDAFQQVTALAPEDVMHWHWLAMSSIAAGQDERYERVRDELVCRFDANAHRVDLNWVLRTCLVRPCGDRSLALLTPLLDSYSRHFHSLPQYHWLYKLRASQQARKFFDSAAPPATIGPQPDDWYILAMVWHKLGDKARAYSAYQKGSRQSRTGSLSWDVDISRETLRREVEVLLADADASPLGDSPSPATAGLASPSALPPGGQPRDSAPSAAAQQP